MKIKAVCERTGLTDRTVRYYIEEGLISPAFTENYLGRKSFDFTEDNISELNDIAVLRSFDFSIDEIKQMLEDSSSSLYIIKAVKERVTGELITSQKKILVLSSLNECTAYTVCELAKKLSNPLEITHSEEKIEPRLWHRIGAISKSVVFFLAVWLPLILSIGIVVSAYTYYNNPIINSVFLGLTLLILIPSIIFMLTSKIKVLQKRIFKTTLLFLCLACIPLSVFTAFKSVRECEHIFKDLSVEIKASCLAEGRVVKRCDICRDVTTETIERLQHSIVTDNKTEPTCTATGLTAGSRCSVCGTVLTNQEVISKLEHTYAKSVTQPTCGADGYVTLLCHCGESYREMTLFANENHDFKKNGDKGYRCSECGLDVCEYGYVDGDSTGGYDEVKYYITGTADTVNEQERTLVIYGFGDMPAPKHTAHHPFRQSVYIDEIKAIIICDGVTSVAAGAFEGTIDDDNFFGNPFRYVTSFIVKGNSLTLDTDSKSMSGIECDITYQRGN